MNKIKTLVGITLAVSLFAPAFSFAQTTSVADLQSQIAALLAQIQALQAQLKQQQGSQTSCHDFVKNLRVGDQGDEVRSLQAALQKEGFSISQDETNNGQYGEGTAAAISGFQEKYSGDVLTPNGLKYGTGFAGVSTRARLNKTYGCGGTTPPVLPPTEGHEISISGITPGSGPIGAQVTIRGRGFTATNNTVNFGYGAITGLPATYASTNNYPAVGGSDENTGKNIYSFITFTVPNSLSPACLSSTPSCALVTQTTTPGTYPVSVTNSNGESNALKFTVTGDNTTGSPVIHGVSGPTALKLGQQGTWVVKASDPNNGTMSYSVFWGDETSQYSYGINAPTAASVQQKATFTHAYNTGGIYYPKFTVTNSAGSAQTSLSVAVGEAHGLSANMKVNGSDNPSAIQYNSTFTASWSSTGATYCRGYGLEFPGTDGSVWTDSTNLPTSGSKTLYARSATRTVSFSPFSIGIQCFDDTINQSATDLVFIPITYTTTPPVTQPSVDSLFPSSGPVGTNVSINGKGFTPTDNTVNFGYGVITGLTSATWISDGFSTGTTTTGMTINFIVPGSLTPACATQTPRCMIATMLTTPGTYPVSVTNANGISNAVNFTVTAATTTVPAQPVINSINPASGPVGTSVVLTGKNFVLGSVVKFGTLGNAWGTISSDQTTLTFSVPQSINPPCINPGVGDYWCAPAFVTVTPGVYPLSVNNANGTSNAVNFTVTGNTTSATSSISILYPAGGEQWVVGQSQTLRFQTSNIPSGATYDVTLKSATNAAYPDVIFLQNGNFSTASGISPALTIGVPSVPVGTYKVYARAVSGGQVVADATSGVFTISASTANLSDQLNSAAAWLQSWLDEHKQ